MTQRQDIIDYLLDGNALTSLEAIQKFGCTRLASQIHALREKGYPIETAYRMALNRYGACRNVAVYRMSPEYIDKINSKKRGKKKNHEVKQGGKNDGHPMERI